MSKKIYKKGSTVAELLVYCGLLMIISLLLSGGVFLLSDGFVRLKMSRSINVSALGIMDRMTREIHDATSVVTAESVFDSESGRLVVEKRGGGEILFYVSDGMVYIKDGDDDALALNHSDAEVARFFLRHFVSGGAEIVGIEIAVRSRNSPSYGRNYYDSVVMRGAY